MNKNGLQSVMLKDNITENLWSATSFIFKRYSKLQIEQPYNGTIKYDKLLRHVL